MVSKRCVVSVLLGTLAILSARGAFAEGGAVLITGHGAVGDGMALNTEAIQAAIDACAEAGGGTVRIPAGRFVTGTVFMKSQVRLYLDMGAVLLGSTDVADYPLTLCAYPSRSDCYTARALIWGEGLENIAIAGPGTLDGQGTAFEGKEATAEELAEITRALDAQGRYTPKAAYYNRPYLIRFISCRNVRIEEVRLRNSAMWMQQYLNCEYLHVRGIHVINHVAHNNDMIDIDGCRFVIVSDCFGDTSDDALTLKSTGAAATEHVVITNCILSSHCNALKMGTESAGGFRDIAISNCVIKRSAAPEVIAGRAEGLGGIALEIVDGGTMERVAISNMTIEGYTAPIFLRLGNRARPPRASDPKPSVGVMRDISLANIVATGASPTGCAIAGLPGNPIENLSISNVRISFTGGGHAVPDDHVVPEWEGRYPESTMFGMLPAYGFYIRHGRDIALSQIVLNCEQPDARPAVVCEDLENLRVTGLDTNQDTSAATVVLKETKGALIYGCKGSAASGFLQVHGESERVDVFPTAQ